MGQNLLVHGLSQSGISSCRNCFDMVHSMINEQTIRPQYHVAPVVNIDNAITGAKRHMSRHRGRLFPGKIHCPPTENY
jgi:hypothetical protein